MKLSKTFGEFGGQYVPEKTLAVLDDLEKNFMHYIQDPEFKKEYMYYLNNYVGRPSPLYYAENLTKHLNGAKIYLKREDLNHTGAHKINNVIGQMLLAKKMNKKKVIAETGAGQHGVATATGAALFGMECHVYMGEEDMRKQALNVYRMELLGAKVHPVTEGTKSLKEAVDKALEVWVEECDESFYVLGSAVGPHPYPTMVKEFQKIIGEEAKAQILAVENRLPDTIIACVGGGSNAIGLFSEFIKDESVSIVGVEAAGKGIATGMHSSAFAMNKISTLHGMKTYFMLDDNDEVVPSYSISSGLDYPGVGPEHAYLKDIDRVTYTSVTDEEAFNAFHTLCKTEGIIPALESSHALAYTMKLALTMKKDEIILVNLSGRGDKDVHTVAEFEQVKLF
ncbi:tryptophan synthase, beta chain [Clostridium collagenovorans DSM 3089]|uniref:Tryptophan synthase beta chain n=1 Tax=Clostridium collagenovorans DSM 3089 TaxID=1121306 RepID=A0A1M5SNK7_9CLOT|nr:tryptophan synthase subunit beta [Clostridium collagenovorans]SHH39868.1 tryptophan synthase, beta chain [Clostridium collagenovorans DSM 3089]